MLGARFRLRGLPVSYPCKVMSGFAGLSAAGAFMPVICIVEFPLPAVGVIEHRNDDIWDLTCPFRICKIFATSGTMPMLCVAFSGAGGFHPFTVRQRVTESRNHASLRNSLTAANAVGVSGIAVFRTGSRYRIPLLRAAVMVRGVKGAVLFSALITDRFGMAGCRTAGVHSIAELLAVSGDRTAVSGAFMPVVGIVAAPRRIPIVIGCDLYRLADGLLKPRLVIFSHLCPEIIGGVRLEKIENSEADGTVSGVSLTA